MIRSVITLCAALLLAVAASSAQQPPAPEAPAVELRWFDRVEPALEEARASKRLVFVDLYADWCGWCKKLDDDVFSTPDFARLADRFVLLRVDVEDRGEGMRLQDRFRATSLPTALVIDPDQVLIGSVRGYFPASTFIRKIESEVIHYESFMDGYYRDVESQDPQILRNLAEALRQRFDGARAADLYRRLLEHDKLALEGRPWLELLFADALRLAGDLDEAKKAIAAVSTEDPRLAEAVGVFRIRLANDQRDCAGADNAVASFATNYPTSRFLPEAKHTLKRLRSDQTADCS
ncbi:MAG: thioredoxin family protein [Acidobacteriota bacterium]